MTSVALFLFESDISTEFDASTGLLRRPDEEIFCLLKTRTYVRSLHSFRNINQILKERFTWN